MNIRNYLSLFLDVNQSKGTVLYCCSTFQHHARFFNNEDHSYPKMSVIWPRACTVVEQHFFSSVDKGYPIHPYHYDVIWCRELYFSDAGLSTRQNMGEE